MNGFVRVRTGGVQGVRLGCVRIHGVYLVIRVQAALVPDYGPENDGISVNITVSMIINGGKL